MSGFSDPCREAAEALLERYWITSQENPALYRLVWEHERELREYFQEKTGWRLIRSQALARLEKLPARPEAWMGIDRFQSARDYALLCTLMAYLESRPADDQFLLTQLCQELPVLFPLQPDALPNDPLRPLCWESYDDRLSLVRVLEFAKERELLRIIDGRPTGFGQHAQEEALFEMGSAARWLLVSYPRDLREFKDLESLRRAENDEIDALVGDARRHRVYRQLILMPALYPTDAGEEDFAYLRNYRRALREDFDQHLPYELELHSNAAILGLEEKGLRPNTFPTQSAESAICLLLSDCLRNRKLLESIGLAESFARDRGLPELRLTPDGFERLLEATRERSGRGWSKSWREKSLALAARDLLVFMQEWRLARVELDPPAVALLPLLARVSGRFPSEFDGSPNLATHSDQAESDSDEEAEHG